MTIITLLCKFFSIYSQIYIYIYIYFYLFFTTITISYLSHSCNLNTYFYLFILSVHVCIIEPSIDQIECLQSEVRFEEVQEWKVKMEKKNIFNLFASSEIYKYAITHKRKKI